MEIGFVGLGKMGGNMVLRLVIGSPDGRVKGGHTIIGFAKDPNPDLSGVSGITVLPNLAKMIAALKPPRAIWVMIPAGDPTENVITELAGHLESGDLIVDGGNSYFKDSVRRGKGLAARNIGFIDVGTSGGIWGRQEGYCMMVGGTPEHIAHLKPILDTLAPKDGWAHVGPGGAGHFVKMVHNGIEYGMMQSYGEGFEVLYKSQFPLDLKQIAAVWNRGSVVRSWLLELAEKAFETQPTLAGIEPYVEDSGEGRWTLQAAIEENVAVPVIAASLFARFASRDPYNLTARFAAALRNQFGGHNIKKVSEKHLTQQGDVVGAPKSS